MIAKKNLVAAAALLAVAAAAQAQVKLYGALDYYVGSVEDAHAKNTSSRTTVVNGGGLMTSFFGISGSEDLGGGLKAEFALESFINGDTGATGFNLANGFWGRGSFIALTGGFGKVAVGQYDNPLFTFGYTYNPFGSSMLASPTMRHLYSRTTAVGYDTGWVNSVTYESPNFSGLQGFAQFAPKESTASGTGNNYTVAGQYAAGPFSAALTYQKTGVGAPAGAWASAEKTLGLGASYDLGAAKVFAQYTDVKETATGGAKDKIYQLGVSAPLSDKATVMASYGADKRTIGSAKTTDKVLSLGYDYLLSKRTDVYGLFVHNSRTDLEAGMSLAVGVKHNF
jgi:predicted porin